MKVVRALIFSTICIVAASLLVAPAFAWYWPIFGFSGPGLGFPAYGTGPAIGGNIAAPLPGTPEWGFSPVGHAVPVLPGTPYYNGFPFHGNINFGPFGYGSPGLSNPGSAMSGNGNPEGVLKT
jgi:hypothetical protein